MASWIINRTIDLSAPGKMPPALADGHVGEGNAHRWSVTVLDAGVAVDLDGYTATAYLRRSDGTVVQPATIAENVVTVVFPAAAYAYAGILSCALRLVNTTDGIDIVVDTLSMTLKEDGSEPIIDPGDVVLSVAELLAQIEVMQVETLSAHDAAEQAYAAAVDVSEAMSEYNPLMAGLSAQATALQAQIDELVADGDSSPESAAARVNAIGTTAASLGARLNAADASRGYYTVKEFGATGDGTTDDTAAFAAAIAYCVSVGISRVAVPDGTYLVGNLSITASIKFELSPGAVILKKSGYIGILATYDYTDVLSVSAVTQDTDMLATLTVADSTGYAVGDIVRVVSEDYLLYTTSEAYIADYNASVRNGQIGEVAAVTSTTIQVRCKLRGTWSSGIRVGRQAQNKFEFVGGAIKSTEAEVTRPVIQIIGGQYHHVDTKVLDDHQGKAVEFVSAFRWRAYVDIGRLNNDSYGVADRSGYGFLFGCSSKSIRHAFTTISRLSSGAANKLWSYGEPEYGVVDGVRSSGNAQAVIADHEHGHGLVYTNISDSDNSGTTFSCRSDYVKIRNVICQNCARSFYLYPGTRLGGITLEVEDSKLQSGVIEGPIDVTFRRCTFKLQKSEVVSLSGDDVSLTMDDCTVILENRDDAKQFLLQYSGTGRKITIRNLKIIIKNAGSMAYTYLIRDYEACTYTLLVDGISFYSEVADAIRVRLFALGSSFDYTNTKLYVRNFYRDTTGGLTLNNATTPPDFTTLGNGAALSTYTGLAFTYLA